ncbi:ABC transporter ATP-binding protein [Paenibacillus polymyxa]
MIQIDHLTKKFPNQKGLFDVSIQVDKGQIFGYLGPNGAGKSTTIRHLMGYMQPDIGKATINGYDCWKEPDKIHSILGYVPGEISFVEGMTAVGFLDAMAGMRNLKSTTRRKELIETFDLDMRVPIRKMSKGMKQKLAIVNAFMHDPEVIILDEPSSGLDPLMQKTFVDLLHEEKSKGKTILISSHIFSELEDTADTIAIIRKGQIITVQELSLLKGEMTANSYEVEFYRQEDLQTIVHSGLVVQSHSGNKAVISIDREISEILKHISQYPIKNLDIPRQRLEDVFMKYYYKEEA